jgi:mannose-6-phosphate isomerase-like protein (cupin superfamily)
MGKARTKAKAAAKGKAKAAAKGKASARSPTRARPTKRRPLSAAKAKVEAKVDAKAARARLRPKQRFVASHPREEDFDSGLRRYAQYRDLGIADATGGMVQAHVIRFVPPCRPEEVSKLHYHEVDFQMVYVLKGWIKTEFDGQGAIMMQTGSAWIQPPRIEHKVLDFSDDCEVLEIILPADFTTVELE